MTNKKILIIGPIPIECGGREYGGVCTHITHLSKQLSINGFHVTLWNYKAAKAFDDGLIRVISNSYFSFVIALFKNFKLLFRNEMPIKSRLLFIYQVSRLKQILEECKFDIIHLHSLKNTVAIALQQLNTEVPFVITDHGFWNQKGIEDINGYVFKRVKKSILGCSKLIYISDFAKQKHNEFDFGQQDKLVKVANPINITSYNFNSKTVINKKTIFFNGLTHTLDIKKLPVLLDAIEQDDFLKENVKLILLSNAAGINYVKNRQYSFEIEVCGKMPYNKVIALYKRSDIFVLPSKSDSYGLVYLEALSFGVPIIGLTKLFNEFQKEITEYIGEPFDSNLESSKILAEKIKLVLDKKIDSKKIHSILLDKYSWKTNIYKYINVYYSVLTE